MVSPAEDCSFVTGGEQKAEGSLWKVSSPGFYGHSPCPYRPKKTAQVRDFLKGSFKAETKSSSQQLIVTLRFCKSSLPVCLLQTFNKVC